MKKILILLFVLLLLTSCGNKNVKEQESIQDENQEDIVEETVEPFNGIKNAQFSYVFNLDDSLTLTYTFDANPGASAILVDLPNGEIINQYISETVKGHNEITYTISKDKLDACQTLNLCIFNDDFSISCDYLFNIEDLDFSIKSNQNPPVNKVDVHSVDDNNHILSNVSVEYGFADDESCYFDCYFDTNDEYSVKVMDLVDGSYVKKYNNTIKGTNHLSFILSDEELKDIESLAIVILNDDIYANIFIRNQSLDHSIRNTKEILVSDDQLFVIDDGKEKVEDFKVSYAFNLDDSCTINVSFDGKKGAEFNVFTPPKGELYQKALGKTVDGKNEYELTIPADTFNKMNELNFIAGRSIFSKTYINVNVRAFDKNIKSNVYPKYDEQDQAFQETNNNQEEQASDDNQSEQVSETLYDVENICSKISNVTVECNHINGEYQISFAFKAEDEYDVLAFDPPNGDKIWAELGMTKIGDNHFEYTISENDLKNIDAITISITRNDNDRLFIIFHKDYMLAH